MALAQSMTALTEILLRQIRVDGPMTVADFMSICLLHPDHGYYTTRDPFGTAGDFITAPEISQMFGEILGLCLAQAWIDQGQPAEAHFVELGPGRGTLMRDMLRAIGPVPGLSPDMHLIEASPALRDVQRATLGEERLHWHDDLSTLPDGPIFFIANEFFDALPIRQFLRTGSAWSERRIGENDGGLGFGLSPPAPVETLMRRLDDTQDGELVELSPQAGPIVAKLSRHIAKFGGAGIALDYGDWRSRGDTLQAVRAHEMVDPLDHPGDADLTAHVDFEALANASCCATSAMMDQGVLLERLGITQRAQRLSQGLSGEALEAHIAAHRRLTHPQEMGQLFKALAFAPEDAPLPPGFDNPDLNHDLGNSDR